MQRTTSQPKTTANRPPATRLVRGRRGRKPPLPSSRRNYQIHPPLFDTSIGDAETTSQPENHSESPAGDEVTASSSGERMGISFLSLRASKFESTRVPQTTRRCLRGRGSPPREQEEDGNRREIRIARPRHVSTL
jgi:hypothetical protein